MRIRYAATWLYVMLSIRRLALSTLDVAQRGKCHWDPICQKETLHNAFGGFVPKFWLHRRRDFQTIAPHHRQGHHG